MSTAQITAGMVKQLREATQAGMMDCKKALEEAGGDIAAATTLLRERGIAKAGKLAGRETTEGRVLVHVANGVGVAVKVGCNTDFVARNDDFAGFVQQIADHIATHSPANVEELLGQTWAGGSGTVEDARTAESASTGENIEIVDFARFTADGGVLGAYQHGTGIGVLVHVTGAASEEVETFATDVAMHIAATPSQWLTRDEVSADVIEAERNIYLKQVEDKPEQIRGKIADGKLDKFFSDVVLLEQEWIFGKDRLGESVTIQQYADRVSKSVGSTVAVARFAKLALKG